MNRRLFPLLLSSFLTVGALIATNAFAQTDKAAAPSAVQKPPPNEDLLGELPITGSTAEHVTSLAILPSLSPDMEDVIVRSVVRRDLELTGLFKVLEDEKAPPGLYGFNDPVEVEEWQKIGAEVIVKVAAKEHDKDHVKIFGLAYFLDVGKNPVYKKTFVVKKSEARITAHRITDKLIGAITGRDGGFASLLAFSGAWGSNHTIFTVEPDGHNIQHIAELEQTSIAPAFGPDEKLFYAQSKNYSPFFVLEHETKKRLDLPFKRSIYSLAFNADKSKLAVAVSEAKGSAIYVGNPDGSEMKKVSNTEIATHPAWSTSGKLAWVGGGGNNGTQRIYVDGKAVSPSGFAASAPAFCNTENGLFLIFAVAIGGDRQDLILTNERGGGVTRLTQNQGSNSYPACSPDGRMLAFFSTRKAGKGLYIKSLKNWRDQRISSRVGQSLRWEPLPLEPTKPEPKKAPQPKKTEAVPAPAAPSNEQPTQG
jgi:TolB protein